MDTTTAPALLQYGPAAYGGKIHYAGSCGIAGCLSDRGYKPLHSVVAEVESSETYNLAAHVEALRAAKISPDRLCKKCCHSRLIDALKEPGA
jgi:hypothetical protein